MKFTLLVAPAIAVDFKEIVDHVNSLSTTWTATVPKFESVEAVKKLLGTDAVENERLVASLPESETPNIDLPNDFDVRSNWPSCASVTGDIRDQSACGSCWAHGSTESFNDRYCIATGSTTLLSTEDALANSGAGSCNGGQPTSVLNWIAKVGVVSGGDYTDIGKSTTCAPYSLPTCQHHNWKPPTPEHPACPDKGYPTPKSFSSCKESGYATSFAQDKVKGGSAYSIKGESNIQSEIAQFGSVSAVFYVYDDLPAYESGVYHHVSGSFLGGHAVAIIGWGIEDGTPYWLIKNSWNTDWGDKGLFKIKRGTNECGIESGISASKAVGAIPVPQGDHHYEAPTEETVVIASAGPDFSQLVCEDRQCSAKCETESYTFSDCLPVVGGGSARGVSCCDNKDCVLAGSDFGLVLDVYRSDSCTGSSRRMKQPVTECDRTSSGDQKFAKFVCGGVNSSLAAPIATELHLQSLVEFLMV